MLKLARYALAAVLCAAGGSAHADDTKTDDEDWSFTFQAENEFFIPNNDDDRYYTQGLQLNFLTPAFKKTWVAPLVERFPIILDKDATIRGGFVIGQNIYTPEDLTRPEPDPNDRPYAGWLYVGAEAMTQTDRRQDALQFQVGWVGSHALGGWAQNNWHKHVNRIPEAKGWGYQLNNEPAFVLYGERRWRPSMMQADAAPHDTAMDFVPNFNFAVGTIQTSAGVGGMFRLGSQLDLDFGPPRIRPAPIGSSAIKRSDGFSWYVFGGADLKVVARDMFLDGNAFHDSRHVDKRPVVGEAQAGVVLRWNCLRTTYTNIWRTEEFLGQNGASHFAAVTFSFPFGKCSPR